MERPYVINCYNPEDWIFQLDDGTEDVRQFTLPIGPYEKNEMSDTVYRAGEKVGYHQHTKGYETFYIAKGSVEVTVRGKRCVIGVGDILHLAPTTPHAFTYLEEGTVWREIFQEINMSTGTVNKNRIKRNYEGLYTDPAFREKYLQSFKELEREPPVVQDVEKAALHEVRTPAFGFSTFNLPGLTLRQKVGRWESNNVKEVWLATAHKGVRIGWETPHSEPELFMVAKGSVRLTALGKEYLARADSVINIPPYTRFSLEALEDGTEILDCGCSAQLLSLLEDLASVRLNAPERVDTPEKLQAFREKYGCFVTYFGGR